MLSWPSSSSPSSPPIDGHAAAAPLPPSLSTLTVSNAVAAAAAAAAAATTESNSSIQSSGVISRNNPPYMQPRQPPCASEESRVVHNVDHTASLPTDTEPHTAIRKRVSSPPAARDVVPNDSNTRLAPHSPSVPWLPLSSPSQPLPVDAVTTATKPVTYLLPQREPSSLRPSSSSSSSFFTTPSTTESVPNTRSSSSLPSSNTAPPVRSHTSSPSKGGDDGHASAPRTSDDRTAATLDDDVHYSLTNSSEDTAAAAADVSDDRSIMPPGSRPSLEGMSRVRNGWRYRLVVMQHPERARMCGFGDKDRRPLSPSLIVKLIITDEATGEAISPWDVNPSLFFLAADLCHPDDLMLAPRNLLVHQHATSVPSAELSSGGGGTADIHASASTSSSAASASTTSRLPPPPSLYESSIPAPSGGNSTEPLGPPSSSSSIAAGSSGLTTVTMEHYTRNLVGAAVTSANVLRDEREEHCIFFVLQDLSVRTEGVYRIRLVFTDLAQHSSGDTNEGVSDALAEAYTEPFTVYSPRRFPGMLEPTELSKKLAAQGVKIAVRSDKKKRLRAGGQSETTGGGGTGGAEDGEIDELDDDAD